MKLRGHKAERRGNAAVKMYGNWTDHMKRPAQVKVSWGHLENPTSEPQLISDGDVKETTDVYFAIAEMAWSMGWRPKGLPGFVAHMINNYKIPQE